MKAVLMSVGYEVLCAETSVRALQLVEAERPDLVLTDIVMPDVSGLELAESIRQRKGAQIPIISITGYPFRNDIHQVPDHRQLVDMSLTKPVQIPDLLLALALCLENR